MTQEEPLVSVVSAVVSGPGLTTLSMPVESGPVVTSAQVPGPGLTLTSASQPGPGLSVLSAQVSGPPGRPGADGAGATIRERLIGPQDGENRRFTTTRAVLPQTASVELNGLGQDPLAHFAITGPREVTLGIAPPSWWSLIISYQPDETTL